MQKFDLKLFGMLIIILILACLPLLNYHKGDFVVLLNESHTPFLNSFFKSLTRLGDGLIFIPVVIILSGIRFKTGIIGTCIGIIHALICSLLKNIIFTEMLRPKAYFDGHLVLNEVPGVTMHSHHAFPSGHTATAFAMAILLILVIRKNWSFLFLLLAAGVGISRIYLGQHFYADVVGGALVGSLSVLIVCRAAAMIAWPEWSYNGFLVRRAMVTSPELKSPREP